MMEIENWMKQYCGAVRAAFGDRVRYIGLQGSRGIKSLKALQNKLIIS